ncbi:DNA-directed RNA polymerases I, II and III (nucleomorph) [Chroomonas mesostigmatica CCMP1168]|uniref:DNA-directed RNA polymerases I, II and III n=1 Tax=Chroomonas mesostigmatica CCMP1168 TaxID=1195612 RepID=J7G2I3_9CRYP|nr:DNA-directed RNA polymerases I, II and III [Chroomonas mesostigmatica CCMP1168]
MEYICSECGGKSEITIGQTVSCSFCGNRILYKKRTKEILVYEAR